MDGSNYFWSRKVAKPIPYVIEFCGDNMNYTFRDWLVIKHPEAIDEGWGKNLAMAGGLAMGAMGATGCSGGNCPRPDDRIQDTEYVSPDAGQYLSGGQAQQDDSDRIKDSEYTSPDAASYLRGATIQSPRSYIEPKTDFRRMFHSKAQQGRRQDMQDKKEQLRRAGRTRGTFVQGQLQP
jgi:hypothetical protein